MNTPGIEEAAEGRLVRIRSSFETPAAPLESVDEAPPLHRVCHRAGGELLQRRQRLCREAARAQGADAGRRQLWTPRQRVSLLYGGPLGFDPGCVALQSLQRFTVTLAGRASSSAGVSTSLQSMHDGCVDRRRPSWSMPTSVGHSAPS